MGITGRLYGQLSDRDVHFRTLQEGLEAPSQEELTKLDVGMKERKELEAEMKSELSKLQSGMCFEDVFHLLVSAVTLLFGLY